MKSQARPIILAIVLLLIVSVGAYLVTTKKPESKPAVENTAVNPSKNNTPASPSKQTKQNVPMLDKVQYTNNDHGFEFALPPSWQGYSIVNEKWEGDAAGENGQVKVAEGPEILIRHPQWTQQNPRQDIPIMVFTIAQWNDMRQDKFHIGAAPINPSELGSNVKYVFALPARYNYAFPTGWEEVQKIFEGKPLRAF